MSKHIDQGRVWTKEELIKGYQEMAELNLALAEDFIPLEEEICEKIVEYLKNEI